MRSVQSESFCSQYKVQRSYEKCSVNHLGLYVTMHGADCQMGLIPTGGPEVQALVMTEVKWMTGCLELSGNGGDRMV